MIEYILNAINLLLLLTALFCVFKVISCISDANDIASRRFDWRGSRSGAIKSESDVVKHAIRKKTEAFLWMIAGGVVIFLGSFLVFVIKEG